MYKEVALQNLFLMNNLNYVVGSMQSYGSTQLLPEEWVSRHRALVNTYKSQYLKVSAPKPPEGTGRAVFLRLHAVSFANGDCYRRSPGVLFSKLSRQSTCCRPPR